MKHIEKAERCIIHEYWYLVTWLSYHLRPMAFRPCFTTSLAQQIVFKISFDSNISIIYESVLKKSLFLFVDLHFPKFKSKNYNFFLSLLKNYISDLNFGI